VWRAGVSAAAQWPGEPRELYAEAYAYYVGAPDRLRTHSQPLFDYFAAGRYTNDNPPR
jgi:hypothetical protein